MILESVELVSWGATFLAAAVAYDRCVKFHESEKLEFANFEAPDVTSGEARHALYCQMIEQTASFDTKLDWKLGLALGLTLVPAIITPVGVQLCFITLFATIAFEIEVFRSFPTPIRYYRQKDSLSAEESQFHKFLFRCFVARFVRMRSVFAGGWALMILGMEMSAFGLHL